MLLPNTAPSGGLSSVTSGTVTVSSITIQWGEVPCLHRNGEITSYKMQALRNGVVETTANISGAATREATLSGLSPSTLEAVNGAGIGPYSTGISIRSVQVEKSYL